MRKLLFKDIILQVVADALLDYWHVQNAVDRWSLAWTLLQAHLYDVFEGEGVPFWQRWVLALTDLYA